MNLFFAYFTLLRSFQKEPKWQREFVFACGLQALIEVFFFETMVDCVRARFRPFSFCAVLQECVWINFFVPEMVRIFLFIIYTKRKKKRMIIF